ncbi:hypothetical protein IKG45_02370 [Candidatus Saccharibacteria bacterium]|nr:hypothetical protein [Candidatus Saccharibacteria bacterium]
MNTLSILADVVAPSSRLIAPSSTVPSSAFDGLSAISAMSSMFSNLFSLATAILVIIGTWKILEKAGEQGWKALIPFYNSYTLYKVFWEKKWFWISLIPVALTTIGVVALIGFGVMAFVFANGSSSSNSFVATGIISIIGAVLLMIAGMIFQFVLSVILNVKIAKAFGKTGGFAVGLILLAPIFYMILGCSKDIKYIKSKEAKKTETVE